jgi:tetratricopeptide (TPR) repeat protein
MRGLAAAPDWAEVHDLTVRGIDRFYRLDTDGALRAFDSVTTLAPSDPRGYFFKGVVHMSLYQLQRSRVNYDAFMEEADHVIHVCEGILDGNDNDPVAKFYLGGIYGYRGMMYQAEGSLLNAVMDGRKGYTYLEEAVIEKPDLYDAHMGFGLFRYLVAKAPRSLQWVLKTLGITPDLEGGLKSLKFAAERGVYTKNEARFFLAQFLFNEERDEEAFRHLNRLCVEYPENTLFLILRSTWHDRRGNREHARVDALNALEFNEVRKLRYVETIACGTLGNISFSSNDFQASAIYFERHLEGFAGQERISNRVWYRLGLSYELTGRRDKAVAAYARTVKRDDDLRAWDAQYYRRAADLRTRPLHEAEGLMIRAGNEASSKKYEEALLLYRQSLERAGNNPDFVAQALYGTMQAHYELGRFADVEKTSAMVLALTPKRESWVLPHACFKLGQALVRMNRPEEARRAFEMVEEYDDYDSQSQLERRVEQELNKLG